MNERQSGVTTRQMLDAVGGSIYIWPELASLAYAIRLAEHLGRTDLQIFTVSDLRNENNFRGREINGLVVDHACYWLNRLGSCEFDTLSEIEQRIKGENP